MINLRNKRILISLLILAFTSQSYASVSMSCESTMPDSHQEMAMSNMMTMDHSTQHEMDVEENVSMDDCCIDCDCTVGGCTVAALLPSNQMYSQIHDTTLVLSYSSVVPNRDTLSLFRPPIFR